MTTLADGHRFFAVPVDYISWGNKNSSGSNYDDPPESDGHIKADWDTTDNTRIRNGHADGLSISLTPNAHDNDSSKCWEFTATQDTNKKATCTGALPTRDTDPDAGLTYSMGENNNAMPEMYITKTSIVIDDPVNGTTHPKRIPGATIRYCFTVKNAGDGAAENVQIHDTLDGGNRDKLTYQSSGKGSLVNNTNDCTESDCSGITNTSGSYDSGTKQVDINLSTPFPQGNHQCAYIKATIK